ncbi:glycosyltransferase [Leptothrix sp. BB-4]
MNTRDTSPNTRPPKKPRVSICVVTYNHREYIAECIQSIIDQTNDFDIEILIGNDASTDGTSDILKDFEKKFPSIITVYTHTSNLGAFRNYKFIHSQANGEYIAHIDGDDKWAPDKIKRQSEFLDKNPECIAVYTNATVIDVSGNAFGVFNNHQPEIFGIDRLTKEGNFLLHSSMMYRSQAKKAISELPEQFIDYHLHIKLAKIGSLGYINSNLAIYRHSVSGSLSTQNAGDRIRPLYWGAISELLTPEIDDKIKVNALGDFLGKTTIFYLRTRQIKKLIDWIPTITSSCHRSLHPAIYTRALKTIARLGIRKAHKRFRRSNAVDTLFLR